MAETTPQFVRPETDEALIRTMFEMERRVSATTPYFFPAQSLERFLAFRHGPQVDNYLLYDDAGKAASYLTLVKHEEDPESLEILSLVVDPEQQHKGYGSRMMQFAEELAAINGHHRLFLLTSPDNAPALALYKKRGFQVTDRKENYYGDGTPRLLLEKKLA